MTAARLRRMDGTGNGEHVPPQVHCQAGGDERARLQGRLHHQRALPERSDEPVAFGKVGRHRRGAQRVFAEQHPTGRYAVGQRFVPRGVHPVQPGADHRDGGGLRVERAFVGRAVHPQSQTRHHTHASLTQGTRKLAGIELALRRGVAAAHHGHPLWVGERRQAAVHEQQRGRIGHLQQIGGVGRVRQAQHMVGRIGPQPGPGGVELAGTVGRWRQQRVGQARPHQRGQHGGGLLKHLMRATQSRQQLACGGVAHARREQQAQPGAQFVALHGASLRFLFCLVCSARPVRDWGWG